MNTIPSVLSLQKKTNRHAGSSEHLPTLCVLHASLLMNGDANGHKGVGPGKFVYPDSPLHELFHQQVARTPDRIAVIDQERELTYTELQRQTQTLALSLRHRGRRR